MAEATRLFFAVVLENAFLSLKGQAFDDFFVRAGTAMWGDDFTTRSPQGHFGDSKCDGYRISSKTVFQCYAPEVHSAPKYTKKIQDAFEGARDIFGEEMQEWIFVHNRANGLHDRPAHLILELQENHPGVTIKDWMPLHLISQILEIPKEKHGILFKELLPDLDISEEFQKIIEENVEKNKALEVGTNVSLLDGSNRLSLDSLLDEFDEQDRDVRRRILGYSQWLDPVRKTEIFDRLAKIGHERDLIESNAQRLHDSELIKITENHYLPLNKEICHQAADSLMPEFLKELGV